MHTDAGLVLTFTIVPRASATRTHLAGKLETASASACEPNSALKSLFSDLLLRLPMPPSSSSSSSSSTPCSSSWVRCYRIKKSELNSERIDPLLPNFSSLAVGYRLSYAALFSPCWFCRRGAFNSHALEYTHTHLHKQSTHGTSGSSPSD